MLRKSLSRLSRPQTRPARTNDRPVQAAPQRGIRQQPGISQSSFEPARRPPLVALQFTPASRPQLANRATSASDSDAVRHRFDVIRALGGSALAVAVKDPALTSAERNELVRRALTDENAANILLGYRPAEPRNVNYDEARAVAEGVRQAWNAGDIGPAELEQLVEHLSEEEAAEVALLLAQDPSAVRPGGPVEAFGVAAAQAGHEEAAALALTSSEALIEAHYPSDADQRAAFEHVNAYLERNQDRAEHVQSGQFRAFCSVAVANAARLTAAGNGFGDGELQRFLEDLGPSLANEVIARATQVSGDTRADGAVELLGREFEDIAADADGDDRRQWEVNAAIAFTSSDALIARNLSTPERRAQAFAVLTEQLNSLRGEADEAAGNYSLLEHPALLDGATRLFAEHGPELIERAVSEGPEAAAELSSFLQDTLYSAHASPSQRARVQRTVEAYADDAIATAGNDAVQRGEDVGRLLAIVQISAEEAIARAGSGDGPGAQQARQLALDVGAAVGGRLATVLVGFVTANPFVGAAVGAATTSVLKNVFGIENPDPARLQEQLEDAFREQLADGGTDTSFGERYVRALREVYGAVAQDLNAAVDDPNLTPEQRAQVQQQIIELGQLVDAVNDAFFDYTRPNNDIREEIEERR